ncbi:hypothetical protein MOBT1_001360 [Malassezia obtusa]|uniref:DUF2423 domain-containing protein n=1 Tax=Malassezia obtusa TaxID=76774 RepID=A0AAF0DY59_9BASI|nr:hypothetical protein MOBT1_001360 [Malassezia obtusa]
MAKSLRSHSKVKARNLKRYTADSDYAVTAAARLNKVASRLQQRAAAPKGHEDDDDEMDEESAEAGTGDNETNMQEDAPQQPKKISTSGPRGSRNEQWRKAHKVKGSKNAGRTKRRR